MIIIKLIEQDTQEIFDLFMKLSSINTQDEHASDELLIFLIELRDTLQLYWQVKQDSIYSQWIDDRDIKLIEFSESYLYVINLVRRCRNAIHHRQFIKGFVQLKTIVSVSMPQLEQEKQYLAQKLPQQFSEYQLNEMAQAYEQYKYEPNQVMLPY